MKVNLYNPTIGRCVNLNEFGVVRIIGIGKDFSYLPGGTGIFETVVEYLPDWMMKKFYTNRLTMNQLKECENTLNELEETLIVR